MAALCVVLSWLSIKGRSALEGRHLSKCQQLIHHWLNTIWRYAMKHAGTRIHTHTHTHTRGKTDTCPYTQTYGLQPHWQSSQRAKLLANSTTDHPLILCRTDNHTHAHLPLFQLVPDLIPTGYEGCASLFNSCRVFFFLLTVFTFKQE